MTTSCQAEAATVIGCKSCSSGADDMTQSLANAKVVCKMMPDIQTSQWLGVKQVPTKQLLYRAERAGGYNKPETSRLLFCPLSIQFGLRYVALIHQTLILGLVTYYHNPRPPGWHQAEFSSCTPTIFRHNLTSKLNCLFQAWQAQDQSGGGL